MNTSLPFPRSFSATATIMLAGLLLATSGSAQDASSPAPTRHQVTGLFNPAREADLRAAMEKLPEIKLESIDFARAEATFAYDAAKAFPGAKPEQILERFDQQLRDASRGTFGVKPLCSVPHDKLATVEIAVAGLDCQACCWAAYGSIYKIDGVESATVSFKEGQVVARIHADRVDRAQLESALKQRGVALKSP